MIVVEVNKLLHELESERKLWKMDKTALWENAAEILLQSHEVILESRCPSNSAAD
jgi:hypothetical protein